MIKAGYAYNKILHRLFLWQVIYKLFAIIHNIFCGA